MKFIPFIFANLCFLIAATSYAAEVYSVSYIYDGDTVKLRSAQGEYKLRLVDIDAPERNQA